MIKHFCDGCGKELTENYVSGITIGISNYNLEGEYCLDCFDIIIQQKTKVTATIT